MPTTPANVVAAWQKRAQWLAQWAIHRLVNRNDAWIRYLPEKKRSIDSEGKNLLTRQAPLPPKRGKLKLNERALVKHFRGESSSDLLAVHSVGSDNTCKWIAIDLQSHNGTPEADARLKAAHHWESTIKSMGLHPVLLDSDGDGGYIVMVFFRTPLAANMAHDFAAMLVSDYAAQGLAQAPRIYPHGAVFDENDWLRIPGRHPISNHWTRAWKLRRWVEGADAAEALLHAHGDAIGLIQKLEIPASVTLPAPLVVPLPAPVPTPLLPEAPPTLPIVPSNGEAEPKKRRGSDRRKTESQVLCYLLASARGDYEVGAFAALDEIVIRPQHFSDPVHRDIFQAMQKLHEKQERITPSCIAEEIAAERRREALDVIDRLILQKPPTADAFQDLLSQFSESVKSQNGDGQAPPEPIPDVAPSVLIIESEPQAALSATDDDADLRSLIEAWPMLSPSVRQEVLAIAVGKPLEVPPPA
jgi:hypothetical protein